jgi:hypothetical protein
MTYKFNFLIIPFLFLCNILSADDGGFYASGNTLIPLSKTSIELRKEFLNLTFEDNGLLRVDIQFEFFNPGNETELIVGFVTPPADGVLSQEEINHPQISDFQVMFEGSIQDFKVQRLDSTGFTEFNNKINGRDYIYYFKLHFKSGENIIKHSYKYRGGFNLDGTNRYQYRLTTGKSWANHQIDEFYLNINFGENKYAGIPTLLEKNREINWHTFGVSALKKDLLGQEKIKVYFKSGGICTEIMNFKPDYDLNIDLIGIYPEDLLYFYSGLGPNINSSSIKELRIMKNAFYAKRGYKFKDEDLLNYFSQYAWYFPDPHVKNDIELLSDKEKEWFNEIVNEINRRESNNDKPHYFFMRE